MSFLGSCEGMFFVSLSINSLGNLLDPVGWIIRFDRKAVHIAFLLLPVGFTAVNGTLRPYCFPMALLLNSNHCTESQVS